MLAYAARRFGLTIFVTFFVLVGLGLLIHLSPQDPVTAAAGPTANKEVREAVIRELQLDQPVVQQLTHFFWRVLHGDLGSDYQTGLPVTTLLGQVMPHTFALALASFFLALSVGVPLGVFCATRPGSLPDRIIGGATMLSLMVPSFVISLPLVIVFAIWLRWLPAIGAGDFSDPVDYARHLIMPSIAIAISMGGYLARLVRATTLEVLGAQYIRSARALGLRSRLVFYKYAMRVAVIPLISLMGLTIGGTLAGGLFVEVIFGRPGVGTLIERATSQHNYPVIQGATLVLTMVFVLTNFVTDLMFRLIDPRIRLSEMED
jgi:peptide/nickel transport system permease protein